MLRGNFFELVKKNETETCKISNFTGFFNSKIVFMIQKHLAQIYKADFRGVTASENFKRLSTFNFEKYQDDSRKPFGSLRILNEGILAPKHTQTTLLESERDVFILPLFGGVDYKDNLGHEDFIRVEQIKHLAAQKGMLFELCNPFEEENVSYLQMEFDAKNQDFENNFKLFDFGLSQKNQLISLFETANALGFIGIYEGRKVGLYKLRNPLNGIFVFVINGAFEVENRLLEAKDGLSLQEVKELEWEALSENAMLLVLEISLK
jgi:quercetin 2,3-dioxygenase